MYVGMILYDLSVPLLLGSWWGLVVGAVMISVVIVRTALEDRTLQRELSGYKEYSQQVRYRLFPRVVGGQQVAAERSVYSSMGISENVVQKLNSALDLEGHPHLIFYYGAWLDTGCMEWSCHLR